MRRSIGYFGVVLCLSATAVSLGDPPLQPLDGLYSFDATSPMVQAEIVPSDAILKFVDPDVVVVIQGGDLGLGQPGDDLDAMSPGIPAITPSESFSILFSVDRATVGTAEPDPSLVSQGVPYNVKDQARRGHAAGDQFISLDIFLLGGNIAGIQIQGSGSNNSQVRNNFDEGGTSFGGDPKTSSGSTSSDPEDGVDGTSGTAAAFVVAGVPDGGLYFSARKGSPSLADLSSGLPPSGATVFFNRAPGDPTRPTEMFASFADLGLVQDDDINAIVVLDWDANGIFDGTDQVLFSLAGESPSLLTIPGASELAARADVFVVAADSPTPRVPRVLAPAAILGLGDSADNIDALDVLRCSDARTCVLAHGMRADSIPAVSEWGLVAFALAVMVVGTALVRRSRRRGVSAG